MLNHELNFIIYLYLKKNACILSYCHNSQYTDYDEQSHHSIQLQWQIFFAFSTWNILNIMHAIASWQKIVDTLLISNYVHEQWNSKANYAEVANF
jgi:hypothetical protein